MKNRKGFFVTGTGTDVGKTFISGAIARAMVNKGIDCGVMKPIESGCGTGKKGLQSSDAYYLKKSAKVQDAIDLISPCRFQAPLAPYAAVLQGEKDSVSWPRLQAIYTQLHERHEVMLLEGAGGLMVPISAERDMSDLIHFFGLPVLLVAQSGLGTINHSLLSLAYGKARGLSFLGIVLNQSCATRDPSEESNAKILCERSGLPVMRFPYVEPGEGLEKNIAAHAFQMEAHPLMKVILKALDLQRSE